MLVDDYGYNNVGYHARKQANSAEIVTPVMDSLAAAGVTLERHYAFRFCSPSRSSFNTGRNPIHVNVGNDALTLFNAADPVSGASGIPRNMSTIAEKLKAAGYHTMQAGKVRTHARRLRGFLRMPAATVYPICLRPPYRASGARATSAHALSLARALAVALRPGHLGPRARGPRVHRHAVVSG